MNGTTITLWRRGLLALLVIVLLALPALAQEVPPPEEVGQAAEDLAGATSELLDRLAATPRSDVARALLIIGGFVLLLIGWRIYNWVILLAGAVIGAAVAVSLVRDADTLVTLLALAAGVVVGALFGVLLYYVTVALVGAYVGLVVTVRGAALLGLAPVSNLAVIMGIIVGALVLLALSFEFLVIFSALVGAQMLALGLDLGAEWTLLLAIVGVVVQIALARMAGYRIRRRPSGRRLLSR